MGTNFLIVDDSSIIRSIVKRIITMAGLPTQEIYEAKDGLEALEVLESHNVDIVFSDLNMPRMGGMQLVDEMANRGLISEIPVVVVSSARNASQIAHLRSRGVRAYLKKPINPERLREVVEKLTKGNEEVQG